MKIERRKHNKFHISEKDADTIIKNLLTDTVFSIESDISEYTPNVNKDKAVKSNFLSFLITLSLGMLILTLIFPVFFLIKANLGVEKIDPDRVEAAKKMADENNYDTSILTKGSRDNTPVCLVPNASGTDVFKNEVAVMDASNTSEGYVVIRYTGTCSKVKLRITGPDETTYTYNMATGGGKDEVFPLQAGDGKYLIGIFENISETQYATAFSQELDVKLSDQFLPFLYPNQYVNFSEDDQAIKYAEYLSYSANSDLDVVNNVYNALISSMTYDFEEAETVESGYIPDIDEVLTTGKGICLDYAVLMTSMLRSQQIPTRMEVGYAGTAYHAWISTYIDEIGWVNGMIHFDGNDWSLMDPTFASTTETEKLANFIGDGTNYKTKYIY